MLYKKEIDGLRAIAVSAVVLSHLGLKDFQGGFVGVDIFFVISGFLITSLILNDIVANQFSFIDFYYRRAKRILPALFVMLFVVTLFSFLLHLPEDLTATLNTLNYLSFFSSNIYFSKVSGYFDTSSIINPLLHTWSLSVEEQYYILFPMVVLLSTAMTQRGSHIINKKLLTVFCFILLSSLIYAEQKVHQKPHSAFFMFQTRLWELMLGSICAYLFLNYSEQINRYADSIKDTIVCLGLVMIFFAIFSFTDLTPTPSIHTLIPTIGTALVILFSRSQSLIQKILTLKPVALVGQASYSIYLWHQPLIAYTRYINVKFDGFVNAFIIFATVIIGYLSWKFVEQPTRNNKKMTRKNILLLSCMILIITFSFSKLALNMKGFLHHFNKNNIAVEVHATNIANHLGCSTSELENIETCILGDKKQANIALLGDSHAHAIAESLEKFATSKDIGIHFGYGTSCPPALGLYRADMRGDKCHLKNENAFNYVIQNPAIDKVILIARWSLYVEKSLFDNLEGGREFGRRAYLDLYQNGKKLTSDEAQRKKSILEKYVESVHLLLSAGKKVILVYPVPEVGWVTPSYLARQMLYKQEQTQNNKYLVSTEFKVYERRNKLVLDAFDAIPEHPLMIKIKPSDVFCNKFVSNRCIASVNNTALYYDDDHLSLEGTALLMPLFKQALN